MTLPTELECEAQECPCFQNAGPLDAVCERIKNGQDSRKTNPTNYVEGVYKNL